MEPTSSSEVVEGEIKNISWELKRFGQTHEILTAAHATSSVVELENPKVTLRYYLQPCEKLRRISLTTGGAKIICKYYNLCVELLEVNSNCVVNVVASIPISGGSLSITGDGRINANKSKKGQNFTIIEEFISVKNWNIDATGVRVESPFRPNSLWGYLLAQDVVTLNLSTQLFLLHQYGAVEQPNIEAEAAANN